jgi:5-methylcytosine-specific restriction endonuclease McrA
VPGLSLESRKSAYEIRRAAYVRAHYEAYREEFLAKQRVYYATHKEKIAAHQKAWHKTDVGKRFNASVHARRRAADSVSAKVVAELQEESGGICPYCCRTIDRGSLDHIIPVAKGGTNARDNLIWCCWPCNIKKNAQHIADFLEGIDKELTIPVPFTVVAPPALTQGNEPIARKPVPAPLTPFEEHTAILKRLFGEF